MSFKLIEIDKLTTRHLGTTQAALFCRVDRSYLATAVRHGEVQAFVLPKSKKSTTNRRAYYFTKGHLKAWMQQKGISKVRKPKLKVLTSEERLLETLLRMEMNMRVVRDEQESIKAEIKALYELWS